MSAAPANAQAYFDFVRELAAMGEVEAASLDGASVIAQAKAIWSGREPGKPDNPAKSEDYTRTESTYPGIGCYDIELDRGVIHFHDASGLTVTAINRPDASRSSIGVCVYEPSETAGKLGEGFICQVSPFGARNIAASLWKLASAIDGGRAN